MAAGLPSVTFGNYIVGAREMTAGRNNAESASLHWCTPPKYVDAIRDFLGIIYGNLQKQH